MRSRSASGQAAADYIALLLVIAVVLAVAATAAFAIPGVGERVAGTIRTGVCIVGGDICRTADARAAGLAPCVTAERSERRDTTVDVAVVRLGEHGEWQLAVQSDGTALVTRLEQREGGGTAGVGLTFSPAGIDASARVALTAGYRDGRAWRFADAAQAGFFVERAMRDGTPHERRPPDVRWDGVAGGASAEASASLASLASVGLTASAEAVLGVRRDGGRRTATIELDAELPSVAVELPGFALGAGQQRSLVADVTWEDGRATELAIRSASATDARLREVALRLDLRDAGSYALAERLLAPGGTRDDLADIAVRAARQGIVERYEYATSERRRGISLAGRLGLSLGLAHEQVRSERRLTDAEAWVRGGAPVRRFDCLGV